MSTGDTDALLTPVFPCVSVGEVVGFYRALGFAVTGQAAWPYEWGTVQWGAVHLMFHGQGKGFKSGACPCVVNVRDVQGPYREFVEGLRQAYGRLPTAGFSRITRLRKGQYRFGVFDPAGNALIFVAWDEVLPDYYYRGPLEGQSRLAQALETAAWLRDIRGFDDIAAARVLDKALARNEPAPAVDRVRALAARAELAVALGDTERVLALRAELQQVPLSGEERERFSSELQAADDLEHLLHVG